MARPLKLVNLLKRALAQENWELVDKAIQQLEKEDSPIPKIKQEKVEVKQDKKSEKTFVNNFVDDLTLAAEFIKDSKKLSKVSGNKEYRKPYKESKLKCSECQRMCEIPESEAKRYNNPQNEVEFVCDKCLGSKSRG